MKLSEISAAQRKRQKTQRAILNRELEQQRKQQEQLRLKQKELAQQEKRRRQFAAQLTNRQPIEQPKQSVGLFDRPEFAALMAQQAQEDQPDQEYGVDFKFETKIDPNTRKKVLYGYWTRHRIQILQDVQRVNQFINLGEFKGTTEVIQPLFDLFHKLGKQYGQVYILFDQLNMKTWPGLKEVLKRLNDVAKLTGRSKIPFGYQLNPKTNEIDQIIAWEVVDRQPGI